MKPNGGGKIPIELESKIVGDFGSFDKFRANFMLLVQLNLAQVGVGW